MLSRAFHAIGHRRNFQAIVRVKEDEGSPSFPGAREEFLEICSALLCVGEKLFCEENLCGGKNAPALSVGDVTLSRIGRLLEGHKEGLVIFVPVIVSVKVFPFPTVWSPTITCEHPAHCQAYVMIAKDAQNPIFPEIVDISKVLVFHSKTRVAKV